MAEAMAHAEQAALVTAMKNSEKLPHQLHPRPIAAANPAHAGQEAPETE